jgi:DNA-binding CsgD family transcriptional regulator
VAAIRALVPELQQRHQRSAPSVDGRSAFEFLDNLGAIRAEVYRAAERTTTMTRALDPGLTPDREVESLVDCRETQVDSLRRGVSDRTVVNSSVLASPAVFQLYGEFRALGVQYRSLPDLATRLTIFDSEQAVIAIDPSDSSYGAIVVRTPSLVEALCYMFDRLWTQATPVFDLPDDSDLPSTRGARILELITLGMTNDRIARSLGIRPRTVGREIANLKTALGVNSRAEIVAAAAKRGWL